MNQPKVTRRTLDAARLRAARRAAKKARLLLEAGFAERREEIIALFTGPSTLEDHVQKCLAAGVWSENERLAMWVIGIAEKLEAEFVARYGGRRLETVARLIAEIDQMVQDGDATAEAIDEVLADGPRVTYEDYQHLIEHFRKAADEDLATAARIQAEGIRRYGP